MCGIYATNIEYGLDTVRNKLRTIEYRGPDNLGITQVGGVSLGHLRLAILDLDPRSNQPFKYKNLSIVFNGEIYNFEQIRDDLVSLGYKFQTTSDTEVLIKGFSEWGEGILSRANGMFAFVIYDADNKSFFVARDRLGVKPLYYYWDGNKIEICSQIGPLIQKDSRISSEALNMYLDCGYVPSPLSIFENIFKLQPGHFMTVELENGSRNIVEYWNLKKVEKRNITFDQAKEELHELLKDAVRIRLRSDVPIGTFLSGGIDSALVSGIASKVSESPINTFTIGFEDKKFDESRVASKYSEIIGSIHKEIPCTTDQLKNIISKLIEIYDEPFADSSAIPSLLLNSVTKPYATVVLSGDGGDESFLGYISFDLLRKFKKIEGIPYFIRKVLSFLYIPDIFGVKVETIRQILRIKTDVEFTEKINLNFSNILQKKDTSWIAKYYADFKSLSCNPFQRMGDLKIKLYLENDCNVKVDRASMASSVEVRSPFLDYRVIEYARNLPVDYRYDGIVKKKILREILKEYIPEEVFNLPKKGFSVPLGQWIREDLKEEVLGELTDEFLRSIPNLDIREVKRQIELHLSGKKDYSFTIWKLFILARWKRRWFNG